MAANITDKIDKVSSGVRPVTTTVSVLRNTGGTTLSCNDLTGWATDTAVHFVTYKKTSGNEVVASSQSDWKGVVSGSNLTSLQLTGGTDAGNAIGDIVELMPTAQYGKDLAETLLVTHNQDGTQKDSTISSPKVLWSSFSNNIKSRAMTEISATTGSNQNLTATNISFTVASNCVAFVTVTTGIISSSDTEHRPQIWLNGGLYSSATDYAAQLGMANNRMTMRTLSAAVNLTTGVNTLSAGYFTTAGTTVVGYISAIVLGNVTA